MTPSLRRFIKDESGTTAIDYALMVSVGISVAILARCSWLALTYRPCTTQSQPPSPARSNVR